MCFNLVPISFRNRLSDLEINKKKKSTLKISYSSTAAFELSNCFLHEPFKGTIGSFKAI